VDREELQDGGQVRRERRRHGGDVQHPHGLLLALLLHPPGEGAVLAERDGARRHLDLGPSLRRDRGPAPGDEPARDVEPVVDSADVEPGRHRVVDDGLARRPVVRHEGQPGVPQLAQQVPDPAAVDLGEVEPGVRLRGPVVAAGQRQQLGEQPPLAAGARQVAALGVPDRRPRRAGDLPAARGPRDDGPRPQRRGPVDVVRHEVELQPGLEERPADRRGALRRPVVVGRRGVREQRAERARPVRHRAPSASTCPAPLPGRHPR
jgi:hypothetical protein